jgi:hypothetical protein
MDWTGKAKKVATGGVSPRLTTAAYKEALPVHTSPSQAT